jgi:heat shock protein HspQ
MPPKENTTASAQTDLINALAQMQNVAANKTNSHFKAKYVSLDNLLDAIKPILHKNNLALIQTLIADDGKIGVATSFVHTSGQSFDFGKLMIKAEGMTPQNIASAVTYLRRITLTTAAGVSVDMDDDGHSISKHALAGKTQPWYTIIPSDDVKKAIQYCAAKGWINLDTDQSLEHVPANIVNAIVQNPQTFLNAVRTHK